MRVSVAEAARALSAEALTEGRVAQHLRPLFSRTLSVDRVYLANHTLGRPLDQTEDDIAEGARLWGEQLRSAWDGWLAEERAYRGALAGLLGIEEASRVVPKVSAGQALRTVLHTLPFGATVLTTEAEFASVAVVLAQFQALGRLRMVRAAPVLDALGRALGEHPETELVVVSQVFYADGRVFEGLAELSRLCRRAGAALLVDCYHALGVLPFTMAELGCDYVIGGCYKYLRGGPGAAFLALAPDVEDRRPLDTGWFALANERSVWGDGGPALRAGGDAWLDGTPAVLPYYAARAGLAFTAAIGVSRLRAYSLEQLGALQAMLAARGIVAEGADAAHGAFLTVRMERAGEMVNALARHGIVVDAREGLLRICPDVLTTSEEMERVAEVLGTLLG